jgi:hypothetical protein
MLTITIILLTLISILVVRENIRTINLLLIKGEQVLSNLVI